MLPVSTSLPDTQIGVSSSTPDPPSPVGFLHLPNELLFTILHSIDKSDLYTISRLSKRLHYLALPIYLTCCGIKDSHRLISSPDVVSISTTGLHGLRGLSTAIFVTSLRSLRFVFTNSGMNQEFYALERFLSSISSIEEIVLDFKTLRRDQLHLLFDYATTTQRHDQALEHAIAAFLHSLNDKSCRSITVSEDDFLYATDFGIERRSGVYSLPTFREPEQRRSSSIISRLSAAVKRLTRRSSTASRYGHSVSPPRDSAKRFLYPALSNHALTTLDTVQIRSLVPFYPAMFEWTVKSLNTSSITDLTLFRVPLDSSAWGQFLPRLTLSALAKLSISSTSLVYHDAANFLSRHPTITHLRLLSGSLVVSSLTSPPTALPLLNSLRATPDYIQQLLDGNQSGFPQLEIVSIEPHRWHSGTFNFYVLSRALESLSRRTAPATLSLEIAGGTRSADWLTEPRGSTIISVTRLEVRTYFMTGHLTVGAVKALPKWLGRFPALQDVAFGRGLMPPDMTLEAKVTLVGFCKKACPGLQSVRIGGDEHEVSTWLAISPLES